MSDLPEPVPSGSTSSFRVRAHIHEDPFLAERPQGLTFEDVSPEETVNDFRMRLSQQSGKPQPDSIKLVVGGRPIGLARGGEKLRDVLRELDSVSLAIGSLL